MARKISVSMTDDIDPTKEADTTVEFSIDGVDFEIDLAHTNADKMRKAFQPWIEASRKIGGRNRGRRPLTAGKTTDKDELSAIREWAFAAGIGIPSRGRIPQRVREQFHAAQSKPVSRVDAVIARAEAKAAKAQKSSDAAVFSE